MKNRGSALMVVLVLFSFMISSLFTASLLYSHQIQVKKKVEDVMVLKDITIMIVGYYQYHTMNGMLFSESYEDENYSIDSTVLEDYDYYEIETSITTKKSEYKFSFRVNKNNSNISYFTYV